MQNIRNIPLMLSKPLNSEPKIAEKMFTIQYSDVNRSDKRHAPIKIAVTRKIFVIHCFIGKVGRFGILPVRSNYY